MSKVDDVQARLTEIVDKSEDADVKILFATMFEAASDCDWFWPYLQEEGWLEDE